jgi:Large polyvalent protein-associated domain 7
MIWVVDRKSGDVTYRLDGKDAFVDVGEKINLIDNREATLAASLKVAQEKFGSYLHVTGSDQLKREIATAAAKHGLNVRFTEDRINHWLKIDQRRYQTRSYGLAR